MTPQQDISSRTPDPIDPDETDVENDIESDCLEDPSLEYGDADLDGMDS